MHDNDSAAMDGSRQELTFQVPLGEVYKFNKPEKIEELAGTHRGDRQKPAALAPAKRFIISTIGIFCLMLGLTGLFGRNPNIFSVLWIVLGLVIVWVFIAKPEIDKRRSAASPKTNKDPEVTLIFNLNKIMIRSPQSTAEKDWPELLEYKKTKKGVHLYFLDGTAIWLPESVFYDKDEMKELVQLLQKKVSGSTSVVSGKTY